MVHDDRWHLGMVWRPLTENERLLLVALTSQPFVGAEALRGQIQWASAQPGWGDVKQRGTKRHVVKSSLVRATRSRQPLVASGSVELSDARCIGPGERIGAPHLSGYAIFLNVTPTRTSSFR